MADSSGCSSPGGSSENTSILFGSSLPISPARSVDSNGLEKVLLTSSQEQMMDDPSLTSSPDMISAGSDKMVSSKSDVPAPPLPPASNLGSPKSYFAARDRSDVIFERKKNSHLTALLNALGIPIESVNEYVLNGKIPAIRSEDFPNSNSKQPSVLEPGEIPQSSSMLSVPSNPPPPLLTSAAPSSSTATKSWSDIVSDSSSPTRIPLSFHPPKLTEGSVSIKPPLEVLKKGNDIWASSLVGHFLGARLPFKLVEDSAKKLWGKYGLEKVYLHDKEYFIFKFSSVENRNMVMALGPWYIAQKFLELKPWQEGADFHSVSYSKAPIWVKLHQIPLSYWTSEGLSYMASGIGKPLFLDKATEKLEPMNFARICIEVEVSSSFPDTLQALIFDDTLQMERMVDVKVEYQNKPSSCPSCNTFGHTPFKCPKANYQWKPKSTQPHSSPPVNTNPLHSSQDNQPHGTNPPPFLFYPSCKL